MTFNGTERELDEQDWELSVAAKSLHQEWDSPGLWPRIEAGMRAQDRT